MPPSHKQSTFLGALACVAIFVTACAPAPEPSIPVIQMGGEDFAFVLPDTLRGGLVRIQFTNDGAEPHHAQFIRLNQGVTRAEFDSVYGLVMEAVPTEGEAAFFRLFEVASLAGGPALVDPGATSDVTMDLAAGEYILLCFIPSPDGVPHLAKGMREWVTVTAPPEAQPAPPAAAGRVDMADFAYAQVPPMDSGQVTLEVTNSGAEPHEMVVVRLDGVSFEQALPMLIGPPPEAGAAPAGPPPFHFVGGVQGIMPGQRSWVTLDLEPGDYALICFIPSPANQGRIHAELGMARPFTVG